MSRCHRKEPMDMAVVPITVHLPEALWRALQALAPHERNANTVIRRAVEDPITSTGKYLDAGGPVTAGSNTIQWQGTSGP